MAAYEGVSSRGGGYLWEYPADPEKEPFPSIWATEEMTSMEARVGAHRTLLHQCPFGGTVPKLTYLSETLDGLLNLDGIRCPGVSQFHQHGASIGRAADGSFHTKYLQTYPPKLCEAMTKLVVKTLLHFRGTNTGPILVPFLCRGRLLC